MTPETQFQSAILESFGRFSSRSSPPLLREVEAWWWGEVSLEEDLPSSSSSWPSTRCGRRQRREGTNRKRFPTSSGRSLVDILRVGSVRRWDRDRIGLRSVRFSSRGPLRGRRTGENQGIFAAPLPPPHFPVKLFSLFFYFFLSGRARRPSVRPGHTPGFSWCDSL